MKVESIFVTPDKPVLGEVLKLTVLYQVNCNNVHIICTKPTGQHIELSETNSPDADHIVTSKFAIEDARGGQYNVSIESLVPDDPRYKKTKSSVTASKYNVLCSGNLTVHICYSTLCVCTNWLLALITIKPFVILNNNTYPHASHLLVLVTRVVQ